MIETTGALRVCNMLQFSRNGLHSTTIILCARPISFNLLLPYDAQRKELVKPSLAHASYAFRVTIMQLNVTRRVCIDDYKPAAAAAKSL